MFILHRVGQGSVFPNSKALLFRVVHVIQGASVFQGDAVFHSAAHLQGEGAVRAWSEDEKFNKHEMMLNKVILL